MEFKNQRIRDPIHDLIEFEADEFENALWNVIQTKPIQRLRRIKQLGFSDFVYPGATHSRFSHSIGVFHTARRLMQIIKAHLGQRKFEEARAKQALAAALVHDLGHGPFSHSFEEVGRRLKLPMAIHENVSDALIRNGEVADAMGALGSGFANDVADIIKADAPGNIYSAVVSSQFDADRLDYIRRDRLMTGTQHSAIDFGWLIANIEVGEVATGVDEQKLGSLETFVLGPKAVYAAEAYVLGLFQLYPTVFFHKATRGAEKLFTELLVRVISLIKDESQKKTGLPENHPIALFAKEPNDTKVVLSLDDSVIWGALTLLEDADDELVRELASRLRDRKLFKSINAREQVRAKLEPRGLRDLGAAVDRACAHIKDRVEDWRSGGGGGSLRMLSDEAERVPYKQLQESKGPLNQIMIKAPSGELVDLGERSKVVRAIEPFKLYRLYVRDEDEEARKFIATQVDEGARHVLENSS